MDDIDKQRKKFGKLLSRVKYPKPGIYEIKVAEILGVGSYLVQPEVAVIKDTDGRIWAIPEDKHCDNLPRLVSRHDVSPGTKLKLTVVKKDGKKEITDVIVIKK